MNVRLPFEENQYAFVVVLLLMVGVASSMLALFRWRGWL
jgi:Mg2+ and Co2+ transporter CorA